MVKIYILDSHELLITYKIQTMKLRFIVLAFATLTCQLLNAQHFQDCETAFPICDKKTYHFDVLNGHGTIEEPIAKTRCFEGSSAKETNSVWLKWVILKKGILTFIIDPVDKSNDFDFILYKKGKNCTLIEEVRCMASGNNIGGIDEKLNCLGKTGLRLNSGDDFEKLGCKYNDDNFLKFLSAEKEEEYVLLVNNYDSQDGFSISFGGTAEFKETLDCGFVSSTEHVKITSLYPNPVNDEISIQYVTDKEDLYTIQLLNVKGENIKSLSGYSKIGVNSKSLNVQNLTSGTYILQLKQGNYSTARKFVKN